MYDQETDTSAPYDNVEFPVRKPGTGTWPGPGVSSGVGGPGVKLYGHQTTGRSLVGSKLAPLVEVEGSEGSETSRLQTINFGNSSSSVSSSTSSAQQQQQGYSKLGTSSTSTQNVVMASQHPAKGESTLVSFLLWICY